MKQDGVAKLNAAADRLKERCDEEKGRRDPPVDGAICCRRRGPL